MAVTVKSKSGNDAEYPIIAHAFWGTRELDASNSGQNVQRLFASVSKGNSSYTTSVCGSCGIIMESDE